MNKLTKLSETHYIVVDDSEIKEGNWCVYNTGEIIQYLVKLNTDNLRKITHSTQPLENYGNKELNDSVKTWLIIKPLSLSEIEESINGDSIEKMAKESVEHDTFPNIAEEKRHIIRFKDGFKAHQELTEDKYTFEQVLDAWELGAKEGLPLTKKKKDELIQSLLPKTEWNVEFVNGKIKLI